MDIERNDLPDENVEPDKSSEKKHKNPWIKIGIILLMILLLLLLLHTCGSSHSTGESDGVTIGTIDADASDGSGERFDPQEVVDKVVAENEFIVFINTRIEVQPDGHFNPMIQNSEANHHACWVEIVDGEETIYKSGVIQPGYKIEQDMLKASLKRGKHDCQALFHVLKGNGKLSGEINAISVNVSIIQE